MALKSLSWSSVRKGTKLPEHIREITRTTIVSTALATRDFQTVHHDHEAAKKEGAKDIFLNIISTGGLVGEYMTRWSGPKGNRLPWFFRHPDHKPLAFAGLWEQWQPPDGDTPLVTFTILTTASGGEAAEIHDRMPVILRSTAHEPWLTKAPFTARDLSDIVAGHHDASLTRYRVSARVNRARYNSPDCIVPAVAPTTDA